MKRHCFIFLVLFIASCDHGSTVSDKQLFSHENDTTIWFADKLVVDHDTFDLDICHHLYKFSDSVVTEWYFKNDTLRPWRSDLRGGFVTWQFINDSVIAGFRAYVPYFMEDPKEAGSSYVLFNENTAYLDRVMIKKDERDPVKLENSKVIIRRLQLNQETSDNILKRFKGDPEAVITW